MHLHFNTLVFDLEHQDNNIIQIGAVLLDRSFNEIGEFESKVYYSQPISEYITELTGQTDVVNKSAPQFTDVIPLFEKWIVGHSPLNRIRLASWGGGDVPVLREYYNKFSLRYNFPGSTIDIKSIALMYMMLSGNRTDKFGLKKVAELLNIQSDGYHDALVDARVTAEIYIQLIGMFSSGFWLDKKHYKVSGST